MKMKPNQKYKMEDPRLAVNEAELRRIMNELELLASHAARIYARCAEVIKQGTFPDRK